MTTSAVGMLNLVIVLLIIFQIKHYVADYVFQNKYMLGKFNPGWDFFWPLMLHACVHGIYTAAICLMVSPSLVWLGVIDAIQHFIVDRIKAGPKYLGRFNDKTKPSYWLVLGADQMAHHLFHYFVIYALIMWR